jgi:hypothetical protein
MRTGAGEPCSGANLLTRSFPIKEVTEEGDLSILARQLTS